MPSLPSLRKPSIAALAHDLRHDVPSGIVVFFVALPLCLGIALASGVPLLSGLVSGIVGGLVVAWLSGSQLSVSGPAAGLVAVVLQSVATLGSFEAFLCAVVLAGALQYVFGRVGAGDLAACFPSAVIKGMLAAIGLMLVVKQLPIALGFASAQHALDQLPGEAASLEAWRSLLTGVADDPLVVTLVSLAILAAWELPVVKRLPGVGRLPAPLVVVLWGVGYHALMSGGADAAVFSEHQRVTLPEAGSLAALAGQMPAPDWRALAKPELYTVAISLAVVASLETLLSLEAADKLDPLKRVAPPNRELKAQGIGNIVAGLLGGLPITAVIVRTSANIQAGARSRLSAVVHGVLLLLSVLFLASALKWLPLAALSAILLHTGFKLARPALFAAVWRQGHAAWLPFAVTLGAILATNLLTGIFIGLGCSLMFVVHANTRGALSLVSHGKAHLLKLNKDVSFFSKSRLRHLLDRVQPGDELTVDGSRCAFVDDDVREALEEFARHARQRGIQVELRAMPAAASARAQASSGGATSSTLKPLGSSQ